MPRVLAALFGRHREAKARPRPRKCNSTDFREDEEALLPPRQMLGEPIHAMEEPEAREETVPLQRKAHRYTEVPKEKQVRQLIEKQNLARGEAGTKQEFARMEAAKQQMLESHSIAEFFECVELLIEEDWLGSVENLPGSMYFVATFGDLTKESFACNLNYVKAVARFMGCAVIGTIQFWSGPVVFLSTIFGWGMQAGDKYRWGDWDITDTENSLYDWQSCKVKKLMGMLFLFTFILNGIFVLLDGKMVWFRIYNTVQYLERMTPNFDFRFLSNAALYSGAFINCWNVLWCSLASYVVVGASETPKDVLLDSLGMLFLYNLDSIGSELGFVDVDDWPGERLGWIFQEMVKKDWQPPPPEETDRASLVEDAEQLCVKGCGRPRAEGGFNTCCRGCGRGDAHDEDCENMWTERRRAAKVEKVEAKNFYDGGETQDWNCGGWLVLFMYNLTTCLLLIMAAVVPVLTALTPFNKIVPELIGNEEA